MSSVKLEQRQKVEKDQERGTEIKEVAEQKLEEAEALPLCQGQQPCRDGQGV